MMTIDVDWLAERFDNLSQCYPRLSLVVAVRPKVVEDSACVSDGEWNVEGRFASQRYMGKKPDAVLINGAYAFDLPKFIFPWWNFYGVDDSPWGSGIWGMWLHRDLGRDPDALEASLDARDTLACLEAYSDVLRLGCQFVLENLERFPNVPTWLKAGALETFSCHNDVTWCDSLYRGIDRWLVFLLIHSKLRNVSSGIGSNERLPVDLGLVSDVGLESAALLKRLSKQCSLSESQSIAKQNETSKQKRGRSWFGLAIIELKKDQDISDTELARRVRVNKSTISRDQELQAIRKTLKQQAYDAIPRGTKFDGGVEAFDA